MSVPDTTVHEIQVDPLARDARRVSQGYWQMAAIPLTVAAGLTAHAFSRPTLGIEQPVVLWCWLFAALGLVYLVVAVRIGTAFTAPSLWLAALALPVLVVLLVLVGLWVLPNDKRAALRALPREQVVMVGLVGAAILQFLAWLLIFPPLAATRLLRAKAGSSRPAFVEAMAVAAGKPRPAETFHWLDWLWQSVLGALALIGLPVLLGLSWQRSDIGLFMAATAATVVAVLATVPLWRPGWLRGTFEHQDNRPPVRLVEPFETEGSRVRVLSPGWPARAVRQDLARLGPLVTADSKPNPGNSETSTSTAEPRLVVALADATMHTRHEIDGLIEGRQLDRLVLVMPTTSVDSRAASWTNLTDKLRESAWGPALREVPLDRLIALRFRPNGKLTVATGKGRSVLHTMLAIRLLGSDPALRQDGDPATARN